MLNFIFGITKERLGPFPSPSIIAINYLKPFSKLKQSSEQSLDEFKTSQADETIGNLGYMSQSFF